MVGYTQYRPTGHSYEFSIVSPDETFNQKPPFLLRKCAKTYVEFEKLSGGGPPDPRLKGWDGRRGKRPEWDPWASKSGYEPGWIQKQDRVMSERHENNVLTAKYTGCGNLKRVLGYPLQCPRVPGSTDRLPTNPSTMRDKKYGNYGYFITYYFNDRRRPDVCYPYRRQQTV